METLLNKVATIEAEAKNIVDTARRESDTALTELTKSENGRLLKIREEAEAAGKKMADKSLQEAQKELTALRAKHKNSIDLLKQAAKGNRRHATALAVKLFHDFI